MGFLEAPLPAIEQTLVHWRRGLGEHFRISRVAEPMPDVLHRLEPLGAPRRELWVSTGSSWVLFMDSYSDGTMSADCRMAYLSGTMHCRGLSISCIQHTLQGKGKSATGAYGAVRFYLYGPRPRPGEILNNERSISAMHDAGTGWRFDALGEVQPFEEVEQYKAKRVQERFTPEMLLRYCAALGIRLYEPSFYRPEGFVFEDLDCADGNLSLAEARAKLRIGDDDCGCP
ncbi:MAG: hypothetical protein NTU53_00010 [Planctomycetota bacterium]|nr:hypothetical protein [Planctomycetota bacterium]